MARTGLLPVVFFTLALSALNTAVAWPLGQSLASAAPPPAPDCLTILSTNLISCLTYAEDGSNLTKPGKGCCSDLKNVVKNNVICLCTLFGPVANTFSINTTRALMLPKICRVDTPDPNLCSLISGGQSPAPAPSSGSPAGESAPPRQFSSGPSASLPPPMGGPVPQPPSSHGTTWEASAGMPLAGLSIAIAAML